MGKITIKHYANTELKAVGKLHPLYVQVIYKRKIYKFKSNSSIFEYVNDDTLKILNENGFLNSEIEDIERTILDLEKLKIEISSKNVSKYSTSYFNYLEDNFKKLIENEFDNPPSFFLTNGYFEIINLVNYIDGQDFYMKSDKVNLISSISDNMGARTLKLVDGFLCIDFIGGSKYDSVLEYFESFNGRDRNDKIVLDQLEIFKEFINL